jgi:hypothetical protein
MLIQSACRNKNLEIILVRIIEGVGEKVAMIVILVFLDYTDIHALLKGICLRARHEFVVDIAIPFFGSSTTTDKQRCDKQVEA